MRTGACTVNFLSTVTSTSYYSIFEGAFKPSFREVKRGIDFPFDIGTFLGVNNPDDDQDRPPKKR